MKIALVKVFERPDTPDIAQPLGIMALDAYLATQGYRDIDLYDMRLRFDTPAEAVTRVFRTQPDVVGLSSLTCEKDRAHELARRIKQRSPRTKVVLGGPYATGSWHTALRDRNIDVCVLGEGELKFHGLLRAWENGTDPASVPGLALRRGDEVVKTPEASEVPDLNALPMPSWDKVDLGAYHAWGAIENLTGRRWAILMTSRGCPYACGYCHRIFGRKFRALPPERVLAEMAYLVQRKGVQEFWISDDIFNFDRERLLDICRRIRQRRWNIYLQFPNGLRADLMDGEMLKALQEAGCYRISYAVESGSERIQRQICKHLDLAKTREVIAETREMGFLTHGFFMLGFPTETREEMEETIEFACRSVLHTAAFFFVTPFEGSAIGDTYFADRADLAGTDYSVYGHRLGLAAVSQETIRRLQRMAYLRFYADPRRLVSFARLLPEKRKLLQCAETFARIVWPGPRVAFPARRFRA